MDCTHLKEVKESTGVEAGLLVDGADERASRTLVRDESSTGIDLEALCDLVLKLDVGAEDVSSRPHLGEGDAMGLVGVLSLDVTVDRARLVLGARNTEGNVVGCDGLDLNGCSVEGEILGQEVAGRLAKILHVQDTFNGDVINVKERENYLPGWGYGLRKRHVCVEMVTCKRQSSER